MPGTSISKAHGTFWETLARAKKAEGHAYLRIGQDGVDVVV